MDNLAQRVTLLLQSAGVVLVVAAVLQLTMYILLAVNRSTPLPGWLALWASALTVSAGVIAVITTIFVVVSFAGWMVRKRAQAYELIDRVDPRPQWKLYAGTVVPIVNLVGAPVFLHELARAGNHWPRDRQAIFLRTWWGAWLALNVLAAITLAIRFSAGSTQWQANGVLLTAFTDIGGAVFAMGTIYLIQRGFSDAARAKPPRRWVVA